MELLSFENSLRGDCMLFLGLNLLSKVGNVLWQILISLQTEAVNDFTSSTTFGWFRCMYTLLVLIQCLILWRTLVSCYKNNAKVHQLAMVLVFLLFDAVLFLFGLLSFITIEGNSSLEHLLGQNVTEKFSQTTLNPDESSSLMNNTDSHADAHDSISSTFQILTSYTFVVTMIVFKTYSAYIVHSYRKEVDKNLARKITDLMAHATYTNTKAITPPSYREACEMKDLLHV